MSTVIAWTERTVLRQRAGEAIVRHLSYSRWLVSPAILAGSTWAVSGPDSALVVDHDSITENATYATFRLSGGTPGASYVITNTVQTDENPTQTCVRPTTVEIIE